MAGRMMRSAFLILALATLAAPALAQNEPFRVVNGTRQAATALNIVRAGQDGWGANILARGPLPPGEALSMRPPEGAGCQFDIRLVLANGQEAVRRGADVCQQRNQVVGGVGDTAAPPTAAAPPPGAGDMPLPRAGGGG